MEEYALCRHNKNNGVSRLKNRKLKALSIVAAGLLVAFVGYWAMGSKGASNQPGGDNAVVAVKIGSIEELVTAQGKLEPKDYVDVGAQVSGQIQKLYHEIGDQVAAGDPIADIDPKVYEARVAANEAQLKTLSAQRTQQQAEIKLAQQKRDRAQTLIAGNAISQQELEDAQTALAVAQAQLKSLNAQIEQGQSNLDADKVNLGYTKIFSPMAGTIVVQDIKEGQTINASQTAPVISRVANLDVMTSRAQVAEADIGKLNPSMKVYFTTLGSGKRQWDGTIRQILPSPETVNDVVLYNVLVDVANKDRQLMAGMTTQMFFVVGSAKDVPVIPPTALGKRLEDQDNASGDAYEVQVMDGRNTIRKTIHVGMMTRSDVEITDGLKPGDKVVVKAPASATEGSAPRGMRGPRL